LIAARDRQAASAKAQGSAAPAKPIKPHVVRSQEISRKKPVLKNRVPQDIDRAMAW
jgi:hypothetical protein